jgi:hypothetical protein
MHPSVPFFGNTRDNTHCYQASIRMILKYFLPKKTFTWKELEKLSAKVEGKWTWPTQMLLNLKKMGFDLVLIDEFDIDAFIERGDAFLLEVFGKKAGEAQIQNSDTAQERRLYKEFRKEMTPQLRKATLRDIRSLLKQGYLLEIAVNASALNKQKRYSGHSVVVYGYDKKYIYLHDPGLPPLPGRKVTHDVFRKAWKMTRSIAAIKPGTTLKTF